jgi:hypothetical protein
MKSKYNSILDNHTNTAYDFTYKQSLQHGTIVVYHFKRGRGKGADRLQFSEEYLKELIERGVIEWI